MSAERRIYPVHVDPIRIVPVHTVRDLARSVGDAAPEDGVVAAPPLLTYRNGPLIAAPEVFTIFWGSAWKGAQAKLVSHVNAFFDFVLTSELIDQLSEYNVPAFTIGHGKRTGSLVVTTPKLHSSVSDTALQHMLQHLISSNHAVPQPSPNTLYFVYTPPGVRIVQGGSASCQGFCGYHNDIAGQIFYAAMPYPGCAGCVGSLAVPDALTSTSSHELCEAITDPIPGQGWYDDTNGEIGDICAWQTRKLGDYTVQLEWSNKAGKCV